MKRDFLQSFLVGEQPLPKEVVDAIMAENGRDIQKAKAAFEDYPQLKQELEQLRQQDPEGARAAARHWEEQYNRAVQEHAQQLSRLEFDHRLSCAIQMAQGRSEKAIRALLDEQQLMQSADPEQAIASALDGLKQESGYLFAQPMPPVYARGTGVQTGAQKQAPATLAGALREKYERK